MKSLQNWTKTHTLATLVILGFGGYWLYKKYGKKDSDDKMTNFTGSQKRMDSFLTNRYANASGASNPR